MAILVLVLFFVYPLKFLFTMRDRGQLFGISRWPNPPQLDACPAGAIRCTSLRSGFAATWGLYAALYHHALAPALRDRSSIPRSCCYTRGLAIGR